MKSRLIISLLVGLVAASTGAYGQALSLAVDDQGVRTRSFDVVVGERFDVVTLIDTAGSEISAAEWVQTELVLEVPGVFRLLHQVYWQSGCDLLLCLDCCGEDGEYVLPLGGCVPPSGDLVLARNAYLDVSAVMPHDFVLTIRGLEPGDSRPSSFDGRPGFYDCADLAHPVVMAGGDAWETGSGVIVPSGALVLNPTPPLVVGAEDSPVSLLKVRYR